MIIRAIEPTDAEQIKNIYSQKEAQENTLQLPEPSLTYIRQRLENYAAKGHISFVAELEGQVVGELIVFTNTHPRLRHVVSFGLVVDGHFAGQGIGAQLISFCQEYAFQWLAARRIELEVFSDNQAAIHLYKKMGFVQEGCQRQAALKKGEFQDVLLMAKLAE